MRVEIWSRTPGNHQKIDDLIMDSVPREGETVTIDQASWTVHAVTWDLTQMKVIILLRDH